MISASDGGVAASVRSTSIGRRAVEVGEWYPQAAAPVGEVLLLHEGLGSVTAWGRFPAQLAERSRARVVAYSREGYGRSEPARGAFDPSYMHEEAAAVGPVIRALELRRPLLVGHSDGASIALIAAATSLGLPVGDRWGEPGGEQVCGLVAMAPHCFVEDFGLAGIRAAEQEAAGGDLLGRLGRHHHDPERVFARWRDVWLSAEFRAWNIEPLLEHLVVPVLAIQGVDDRYGTLRQIDVIAERAIRAPRVERAVLQACGHAPHREQPEATVAAITAFARECWASAQ